MSGNIVNRSRPGKFIDIILDEVYNKSMPKPINLRPGYDIEYIRNRYGFLYPGQFEKIVEVEKIYDNLSIISSYETPQQWAIRVKDALQALITEGHKSYYHVFCLFGSSGQGVTKTYYDNYEGREVTIGYQRPNIHNSKMAICFDCWKLVKIPDVKPRKTYFNRWRRYGYEIKPEDLIKHHWNNSCFKTNKHIEAFLLARSKSEILCEKSSDRKGILYPEKIIPDSLFPRQTGLLRKGQMVINPEMQEEYVIACEEFYAYFRKHYSKYIGIINPVKLTPPYEEYIYCSSNRWIEVKKYQLERRLDRVRYGPTSDFSRRFLLELLSVINYHHIRQNPIYEFLTTTEERQINAMSVIYLGMKENRWVSQTELKSIVEQAVGSASNVFMEGSSRQLRIF
ncbi:hypothetical protein C1645_881058 [Glomus cerebriforme]|uniref:Uncharacterized protein n=1 Tax=Glomus cerebriforme TaxID=658196 RepID=A0A397SEJ4_9GLOM|nr:hypothetical protein C1645_881058 [Glomus cerebriforme]